MDSIPSIRRKKNTSAIRQSRAFNLNSQNSHSRIKKDDFIRNHPFCIALTKKMQSISALSICKINKMSNNFAVIAKYRVIGKMQKMRAKIDEIVMQKLTDSVVLKTFTI